MTTRAEQAEKLRQVRSLAMSCYEEARAVLRDPWLRGGDLVMLKHPFKDYFMHIYDNLGAIADEVEAGEWDEADG